MRVARSGWRGSRGQILKCLGGHFEEFDFLSWTMGSNWRVLSRDHHHDLIYIKTTLKHENDSTNNSSLFMVHVRRGMLGLVEIEQGGQQLAVGWWQLKYRKGNRGKVFFGGEVRSLWQWIRRGRWQKEKCQGRSCSFLLQSRRVDGAIVSDKED